MLKINRRTIGRIGYLVIVIAILLTAIIVSYSQTPEPTEKTESSEKPDCPAAAEPFMLPRAEPDFLYIAIPPHAQGKIETSDVKLELKIDEKGKVITAIAVSGHPLLVETAEAEVRKLAFEPKQACGKPIAHRAAFVYRFQNSPSDLNLPDCPERSIPSISERELGVLIPKSEGVSGKIEIRVTMDENGKYSVKQVSGNPRLFERAKEYVDKAELKPTAICGKAVADTAVWKFDFKIEEEHLSKGQFLFKEGGDLLRQNTKESKQKAIEKFKAGIIEYRKEKRAGELMFTAALYFSTDEELEFLAEEAIRNAIEIYREEGKKFEEGNALIGLGNLLAQKSDRKGLEYLREALKIYGSLEDKTYEAYEGFALIRMGLAHLYFDENENALKEFKKAVQSLENIKTYPGPSFYGQALSEIAKVYLKSGKNKEAIGYFEKALPIFKKYGGGDPRESPYGKTSFQGKANVGMDEEGNWVSFLRDGEFGVIRGLGKAYFNLGQHQTALDYYNKAVEIENTYYEETANAEVYSEIMDVWNALGNRNVAIFYGKKSVNLIQKERAERKESAEVQKALVRTFEQTYRKLADLLIADGRFAQAEQVLQMLKEEEHFEFVRRDADEIKNLNQRVSLSEKEQKVLKKYTEFADRILLIEKEYQKLREKKSGQLRGEKEELSAAEQKRFEELSAQLATANAAFKLFLDKQLVEELGKETAREIEYDRNLQAKLRKWGNGTVALYTVVGADRYRVILTTPTVQIDGKTEIKAAELNKKVFAFRAALQNPDVDPRPLAKELYDILIKPIEKQLTAAGAKTLVWSLDGTLRYIPLAALSPDGQSYLVEKYQNAIITPKTRDDISDSNSTWRALGLGVSTAQTVADPEDQTQNIPFSALAGTERELRSIVRDERTKGEQGVLAGTRFLNKDFTVGNFTDSLLRQTPEGSKLYTVVHIASHFRLGSNWSNSFLLLGDGKILTLEQISNSPDIEFGDVDLITLSACNTGFADDANGKEVDSLAEAIQTKSGRAVLATLWAVADNSTAQLMSEFYRQHKENPRLMKSEALQLAQKALIGSSGAESEKRGAGVLKLEDQTELPKFEKDEKAPFAHPFYWSPFVLIGNWR